MQKEEIRAGAGLNQSEQVELTHSLTWQEVELLKLRPLGTEVHGELRHAARHGWTSRQPEGRCHGHPGKGPIRAQLHSHRDRSQTNRRRQRNATNLSLISLAAWGNKTLSFLNLCVSQQVDQRHSCFLLGAWPTLRNSSSQVMFRV